MNVNKLKGARVGKGLTQKQLALMLGMTEKTYNRKELGLADFARGEILRIAELLDLSLQDVNVIFFGNKLTDVLSKGGKSA